MSTKEISVSIDIDELEKQLEERRELKEPDENELEVRSTVFSLGKDPQVGMKQQVSVPNLQLIEILKDGLDNPYLELSWQISRHDVDAAGVIGFGIFRRRLSREEIERETRDRKKRLRLFSRAGFDKVAKKNIRKGKFSSEKKAIFNIRRSLIPSHILNSNLHYIEDLSRRRYEASSQAKMLKARFNPSLYEEPSILLRGQFENFLNNRRFEKIGYVDYTKFLAQEKKKFVSVIEREFVNLTFKDKKVGYSEVFEYYIISMTEDSQESVRSNVIKIKIEDLSPIRPPLNLSVRQLSEKEVQIRACVEPTDDIAKIIVFRRSEDEIIFKRVATVENLNDCMNLIDATVKYGKSYIYRVFLENVHGTLSEPSEIEYISSVQKITPQSRSNNLKIPILTAVQDQNSDHIKITISPNDPDVSYYELERRDLTIYEKTFTVPEKIFGEAPTGKPTYGGIGWETNKFFVDRKRNIFEEKLTAHKDLLNKRSVENEIIFVDNTVSPDHIYQYRVRGFDLFTNPSPHALVMVRVIGKKPIRTPINLRSETLRGSPFRIKFAWNDDNLFTAFSASELFKGASSLEKTDNKFIYKVQRRKLGENVYETFPLTANGWIIDEIATLDAVDFTPEKVDDTYVRTENIEREDDTVKIAEREFRRPFGIPDFLKENDIYFYRVAAIAPNEDESNFSEEFEISTLPDLSNPIDFKAIIVNTNIRPLVVKLTWGVEKTKAQADHYIIERKIDTINDNFEAIGRSYIETEFFDKDVEVTNTYIYRIKAIDTLGRESTFFETRLTV